MLSKKLVLLAFMTLHLSLVAFAWAGTEGMESMPVISPKKIFTVKEGNDLESQRGFGDKEPEVRMMNLMMVEGSGMEGVDMNMAMNDHSGHAEPPKEHLQDGSPYEFAVKSPAQAKVGTNKTVIAITDKTSKKPVKGLSLKAKVYMTSMDMGTEEPPVKETSAGTYELKAPFAMKGPWAVKLIFPDGKEKILSFEVQK
jgi:hypothetical protein